MTEITTYLPALNRYGDADIAINNEIGCLVKYEDHAAVVAALNERLSRYTMSPGQYDQRRSESDAVRVALGFAADADDVSPSDLLEKIAALNEKLQALAVEKLNARDVMLYAANNIAYAIFNLSDKKLTDLKHELSDTTCPTDSALLAERELRDFAARIRKGGIEL